MAQSRGRVFGPNRPIGKGTALVRSRWMLGNGSEGVLIQSGRGFQDIARIGKAVTKK